MSLKSPVAVACCFCLAACGGIAERSLDDANGWNVDEGPSGGEGPDPAGPFAPPPHDASLGPEPDCSGDFGEPEVLFEDPGWMSQALAPSANGLEFYYARLAVDRSLDDSGTRLPTLRTRSSIDSDFGEPSILSHLATACEEAKPGAGLATLDLSYDGKRLYLGCSTYDFGPNENGPLLLFERAETGKDFNLAPTNVGQVGISLGLTRDELTAFGTSLDPSIEEVVLYQRSSIYSPFGRAEIAPGSIELENPEPSATGRELWGTMVVAGTTARQIAVTAWNAETREYEPPTSAGFVPPGDATDASPALSGDCRSLYFARFSKGSALSQVVVARR